MSLEICAKILKYFYRFGLSAYALGLLPRPKAPHAKRFLGNRLWEQRLKKIEIFKSAIR